MEPQSILVVLHDRLHLEVSLVSNYVVDFCELDLRKHVVQDLFQVVRLVPREERSSVVDVLNESVSGVPVGFDGGNQDSPVLITHFAGRIESHSSIGNCVLVHGLAVLDIEADVPDSVTVIH